MIKITLKFFDKTNISCKFGNKKKNCFLKNEEKKKEKNGNLKVA